MGKRAAAKSGITAFAVTAVILAGCAQPLSPGPEPVKETVASTLGWLRGGVISIPPVHVGDLYRVEYDLEWSTAVSDAAWRVREAPGPFLDQRGVEFDPPAVLEEWAPGEPSGRFLVLGPSGDIAATVEWTKTHGEPVPQDLLPDAWRAGEVRYGPYGVVENPGRIFLFLSLAGRTVDAASLTSWQAYRTSYEAYAWASNGTTHLGAVGRQYHFGAYGSEGAPHEEHVEYQFHDAPLPTAVVRKAPWPGERLEGGALARLSAWQRGDGPQVRFDMEAETMSLPSGRLPPAALLHVGGLELPLPFERVADYLGNASEFQEWTALNPGWQMIHGSYDDLWVAGPDDEARPEWRLRFEAPDGGALHLLVSLNRTQDGWSPALLEATDGYRPGHLELDVFERSYRAKEFRTNMSRLPSSLPLSEAVKAAETWAGETLVLAGVSIQVTDRRAEYVWPQDWPKELWSGGARACFAFRHEGEEPHRFGLTNVHMDLVTGWAEAVDKDADLAHCTVG